MLVNIIRCFSELLCVWKALNASSAQQPFHHHKMRSGNVYKKLKRATQLSLMYTHGGCDFCACENLMLSYLCMLDESLVNEFSIILNAKRCLIVKVCRSTLSFKKKCILSYLSRPGGMHCILLKLVSVISHFLNLQWTIIALSASSLDGGSVSLMSFSQRLKTFKPQDLFDM